MIAIPIRLKRIRQKLLKGGNQFPFPKQVLLLLLCCLVTLIAYQYEKGAQDPKRVTNRVAQDVAQRRAKLKQDRQAGHFEAFYRNELGPDAFPGYYLFILAADELKAWSSHEVCPPEWLIRRPDSVAAGRILQVGYGHYFVQSWPLESVALPGEAPLSALTLIPIAYHYPLENKFLQNNFVADPQVKTSDVRVMPPGEGTYLVKSRTGKELFSLDFINDPIQNFKAGWMSWLGSLVTALLLFAWVHRMCIGIGKRKYPIYGWYALITFCIAFLILLPLYLPAGFRNSKIFNPEIFASTYLQSFGSLYLFVVFTTWVLIYFIVYIPFRRVKIVRHPRADFWLKLLLAPFLIINIYAVHGSITYQMVIDSKISFEVSDFSRLTVFTFLGLYLITLSTINMVLLLAYADRILQSIRKSYWFRYGVFLTVSLLYIFLVEREGNTGYLLIMMVVGMLCLLLVNGMGKPIYLNHTSNYFSNSARNYIWFAWLCALVAMEVFYFNYSKEKQLRQVFAVKKEQKDDAQLALDFFQLQSSLPGDSLAYRYWRQAESSGSDLLHFHLLQHYFKEEQTKYQIRTHLYDAAWKSIGTDDSLGEYLLAIAQDNNIDVRSGFTALPPETDYNALYFAAVPMRYKDSLEGYIGIELTLAPVQQEYRQANFWAKEYNATDQQYFDQYSYGLYHKGDLVSWGGARILPYRMSTPNTRTGEYQFKESWQNSLLIHRSGPQDWIMVNYQRNLLIHIVSLFSYVLAIVFLIYLCIRLFSFIQAGPRKMRLERKLFNLTIRTKVNLAILSVVFVALFMVGAVTISIISRKYREDELRRIRYLQGIYEQNILHYVESRPEALQVKELKNADKGLTELMQTLAMENGVDMELFDLEGKMIATARPELVRNGFVTPLMNPAALKGFSPSLQPELFIWEKMADVKMRSIYNPVRNKQDQIIGYMKMPYMDADTGLYKGLSNIVVTLLNMYTLVFFLSGLASIFISNSVIRSFRLLINQFRAIRLKHNELIHWPYRDEVGLLVNEYNIMIRKVEDMAFRLARTEREDAWRDIARQVAHEIKNPLTPMKLHIQFLQQAMRNKHPQVEALTQSTTESLIEQIENLNVIATEFSNFARMPDPQPELIYLQETLANIIGLFRKSETARIFMVSDNPELTVYMDKSFFIRIFNNLIKNAIQAIPDDREGLVEINCMVGDNDRIEISVKDNGTGIPESLAEKIFIPYFTSKSSGTGIGLPMTKHMVELSGGRIHFKTEVGRGTVFYIALPENNPAVPPG